MGTLLNYWIFTNFAGCALAFYYIVHMSLQPTRPVHIFLELVETMQYNIQMS